MQSKSNADHHARIDVLDTKLTALADSVSELAKSLKVLSQRPEGISWKEVLATLGTCAALYLGTTNIIDRAFKEHNAVYEYRLLALERRTAPVPVMRLLEPRTASGQAEARE